MAYFLFITELQWSLDPFPGALCLHTWIGNWFVTGYNVLMHSHAYSLLVVN